MEELAEIEATDRAAQEDPGSEARDGPDRGRGARGRSRRRYGDDAAHGDRRRAGRHLASRTLIADEDVVDHRSPTTATSSARPIDLYRSQRRGGTGRMGMKTKEEDFVEHLFVASTHATSCSSPTGADVHWLKVYEIPDVGPRRKGKAIVNLVRLQDGREDRRRRGRAGTSTPRATSSSPPARA